MTQKKASLLKLWLVLLVCVAPVIASYFAYYVWRPAGAKTNYGQLIEPQRPLPPTAELTLTTLDGHALDLHRYRSHWIMLSVDDAACPEACEKKLYAMRQIRLTTNQEREKIERVWLITDQAPTSTMLIREYDGMHIVRAQAAELSKFLPTETNTTLADHIYLIDPLGNLMMRFPKELDLGRMKKDVSKLLKVTSGWMQIQEQTDTK